MAQIKKEQLKKIINKEYTDILKEIRKNEVYFNRMAREQAIKVLIKEGILDEQLGTENFMSSLNPWSSANKMRRGVSAAAEEEDLQPGESWGDARTRLGYGAVGQPGADVPVEGEGEERFTLAGEETPEEFAPVDFGPGDEAGLPPHFQQELVRITQSAPPEFRENVGNVGNEVFNALHTEVGGLKTQEQLGELVLQIISTVVNAMGAAGGRKWAAGVGPGGAFQGVGGAPFLDQAMAMRE
jgi:hypothetical protein